MIDLPAMIQQCAPNVGSTTMAAIIRTESGGHPWALNDNTIRISKQPRTKEEAISVAKELIARGHSVDIGLGQINSKNLPRLGLTVEEVIEPCTNLKAAAAILTEGYGRAMKVHGPGQKALYAALSTYNTGSLERGFANGYVQKVVSSAGVPVKFAVPQLAAGSVFKGRNGAVQVRPDGGITPWNSPLVAYDYSQAGQFSQVD